ncbi:MAG: hypothetical protein RSB77_00220 [Bacilli bacterium]
MNESNNEIKNQNNLENNNTLNNVQNSEQTNIENSIPPINTKPNPEFNTQRVLNPNVENKVEIKVSANAPTRMEDMEIKTVTVDSNSEIKAKVFNEEEKFKVTGTANAEDLKVEEIAKVEEVLDERVIKRELKADDAKFKKNIIYIVVFIAVILLAIAFFPIIIRILGF